MELYYGKPILVPGNLPQAQSYNKRRNELTVKHLGTFLYESAFPREVTVRGASEICEGSGYMLSYSLYEIHDPVCPLRQQRPGEWEKPMLNGRKTRVSYVAVPQIRADLAERQYDVILALKDVIPYSFADPEEKTSCEPYLYKKGFDYIDLVDPGAVALSIYGTIPVADTASDIVDTALAQIRKALKISYRQGGRISFFVPLLSRGHMDSMIVTVLSNSLPKVYEAFPGKVEFEETMDPALNPDMTAGAEGLQYRGRPCLLVGLDPDKGTYNPVRQRVNLRYLGEFFYDYNVPYGARGYTVGTVYPERGYRAWFDFYEVRLKGNFKPRNLPGERLGADASGKQMLITYAVVPKKSLTAGKGTGEKPYLYREGERYVGIADPGAIALMQYAPGRVGTVARQLVNRAMADARKHLKVTCEERCQGRTIFTEFAEENHMAVMASVVLESSLGRIFRAYPGVIPKAPYNEELNPV